MNLNPEEKRVQEYNLREYEYELYEIQANKATNTKILHKEEESIDLKQQNVRKT